MSRKTTERSVINNLRQLVVAIVALSSRFAGPLASRFLFWAFSTPLTRRPTRTDEQGVLDAGERFTFSSGGRELVGWRWGSHGPVALLVHGWAGSSAQLTPWVEPLRARGYAVVAVDLPAHGASPGWATNALIISRALNDLADHIGPLSAIIAHSFGGFATSLALQRGLTADRVVLISSPLSPVHYLDRLFTFARIPKIRWPKLRAGMEEILGERFADFDLRNVWRSLDNPLLVIHDEADREVPADHQPRIAAASAHATTLRTRGLGHNRILRDPGVIGAGTSFIDQQRRFSTLIKLEQALRAAPDPKNFVMAGVGADPLITVEELRADLEYGQI